MDHRRLSPSTLRYVRRVARSIAKGDEHLADDLEQTTLLIALQKSPRDEDAERSWLFAICANTLRSLVVRDRLVLASTDTELPSSTSEPIEDALDDEFRDSMRSALDALPPAQSEAVALRYLEGLPPREIASLLDVPVETVRTRAKRGLAQLRRDLQESGVIERRSSVRWPLAFGVPRFFKKRRVAALGGVAAVVGAVVIADRLTVERAPDPGDAPGVARDTSVALAPPADAVGGVRTAADLAVDLHLTAAPELLERWKQGIAVDLEQEGGKGRVVRIEDAEGASVPDLEPGSYVARVNGSVVGRRALEAGPQSWELSWGRGIEFEVLVLDTLGQPAAEVEVWEASSELQRARVVGRTDGRGRARVEVASLDSTVAARGRPGVSSGGALLADPAASARGEVVLQLVERSIVWATVSLPDEPAFEDAMISGHAIDQREGLFVAPGLGMRDLALWLPFWENDEGQFALPVRQERWVLRVESTEGDWLWTSPVLAVFEPPLTEYTIAPTTTYRGRFVNHERRPFVGASLAAKVPGPFVPMFIYDVTDDAGRFELRVNLEGESPWLTWKGANVVELPAAEGGIVEVGEVRLDPTYRKTLDLQFVDHERAELRCWLVPPQLRGIPPVFRLSDPEGGAFEYDIDEDGKVTLPLDTAMKAGLIVERLGEDPRAKYIPPRDLNEANGELQIDLSSAVPATVTGRIEPEYLPVTGVLMEQRSGVTEMVTVDTATGIFRAENVIPGSWCACFLDGDGGSHWSRRAVTCEAGETADLGLIGDPLTSLRVILPAVEGPWGLEGGKIVVELLDEIVASRVVQSSDVARGYVDFDVPAGTLLVKIRAAGMDPLRAFAHARAGVTEACEPRPDMVELMIHGWYGGVRNPTPEDARIEVYGDDGDLLAESPVRTAASRMRRSLVVVVPRTPFVDVVYLAGDERRQVRYEISKTNPSQRLLISRKASREQIEMGLDVARPAPPSTTKPVETTAPVRPRAKIYPPDE